VRTIHDLSHAERRVLADLRRHIAAELPGLDFRMTLFGSRARGDAEPDSDMDVLLELAVERFSFADKRRLRRIAGEVSIASGITVSLFVVDRQVMAERGDFSVFENIREEGIVL
jgi:uncharacterized protein